MISGASTPVRIDRTLRQTLVVSAIILTTLIIGVAFTLTTWHAVCADGLMQCFNAPQPISTLSYLILATIRPFTLLPQSVFWLISAHSFHIHDVTSTLKGFVLILAGSLTAFFPIYSLGYYGYKRLAKPWLLTHLPKNLKKAQKKTTFLVIQTQLIGLFHKDLSTLTYGMLGMPLGRSLKAIAYVEAPRVALFCLFCFKWHPIWALGLSYGCGMILQLCYIMGQQLKSMLQGSSYLRACRAQWHETFCEIQTNNISETLPQFQGNKAPILLLYGFFASRRTLIVMEKLLRHRGYDVFTLNLGGLFDVFFTKSIPSSAVTLDHMLKPILAKHNLTKISIIAHSKGGLVAAWWLLRLKGHQHCHNLITLGSPFGGTYFTWVALITPLGLFWQDVWQMRPHSRLLKALSSSYVPAHLKIYCLYSSQDRITRHRKGIFQSHYGHTANIIPVPMHQYSHFQYLYKKGVIEKIHQLLTHDTNDSSA